MTDFNLDSNVWYQIVNSQYAASTASLRVGDSDTAMYMYATNTSSPQQRWQIYPVSDGGGWNIRAQITGAGAYVSQCDNGGTASTDSAPVDTDVCMALGAPTDTQRRWILSSNSDGTFNIQLNVTNPLFEGYYMFDNDTNVVTFTNDTSSTGLQWSFQSITQINDDAFSTATASATSSATSTAAAAATTTSPGTTASQSPTSATGSSQSTPTIVSASSKSGGGLSSGASAGIGVGVAIAVLAIACASAFWLFRRRSKRSRGATSQAYDPMVAQDSKTLYEFSGPSTARPQAPAELQHTSLSELPRNPVAELSSDARGHASP